MNTTVIQEYAETNWKEYAQPFTEISKNNYTKTPLVKNDTIAYNFDLILR